MSIPTSPTLNTDTGVVRSEREFSGAMTLELTDDEIKRALAIILPVKEKYHQRFVSFAAGVTPDSKVAQTLEQAMEIVEEFEDEIKTRLMDMEILATVDVTGLFQDPPEPIAIEWLGKLPTADLYKYGMDHEKKEWEVKRATNRREDYYGQKD